MANTMTMQEQIEMSGLEIMSSLSSSSSSLSLQLQWNPTNQWSPLLGGGQAYQACCNHSREVADRVVGQRYPVNLPP